VGRRAVLDAVVKRKIPSPPGNRTLEQRDIFVFESLYLCDTTAVNKRRDLMCRKFRSENLSFISKNSSFYFPYSKFHMSVKTLKCPVHELY
jgi:hypothetical protein